MQDSKITKRSLRMFFNNPDLVFIQKHLIYKNVYKMKALLRELLYDKINW